VEEHVTDITTISKQVREDLKIYDTVAEMLADTVSVSENDVIQADRFHYTVAASDATNHHLTRGNGTKLYVSRGQLGFDVKAFGALGDGTTDDTAAVLLADAASRANKASLHFEGNTRFDPSQMTVDHSDDMTWYVNGKLTLISTLDLPVDADFTLIGLGGADRQIAFMRGGPVCEIVPPSGNVATIRKRGVSTTRIENVVIENAYDALHVDGSATLTAYLKLQNVGLRADATTGRHALHIDNCFWVIARECAFTGGADHPVYITSTNGGSGYSGLIWFYDCVTAGHGLYAGGGDTRSVWFHNHVHELLESGEYAFEGSGLDAVGFYGFENADPKSGSLGSLHLPGTELAVLSDFDARVDGTFPRFIQQSGWQYRTSNLGEVSGVQQEVSGLFFARPAWNVFNPYISTGFGDPVAMTYSGNQGNMHITTGALAPDGTTTAFTIENTNDPVVIDEFDFFSGNITLNDGDILVAGVSIYNHPDFDEKQIFYTQIADNASAVFKGLSPDNGGDSYRSNAPDNELIINQNWINLSTAHQVVSHPSSGSGIACKLVARISPGTVSYTTQRFWNPWMRVLRVADGFDWTDALKLMSATGYMRSGLPKQHTAIPENHMFLTGKSTTANRPSSPAEGAQWFDTTLGKPIWYDGSGWVDATGTSV
jgi:hypothetical protein